MTSTSAATTISQVIDLYLRRGGDPYDESLAQLDHGLQTAASAEAAGASDDLVSAALLHDVGHLLELDERAGAGSLPAGDRGHEAVGARWLGVLFGPSVTGPIALHVRAKRYLAAVDATYLDALSAGSRRSLALQGGPLSGAEAAAFERNPGFEDAVALRRWDDAGKVVGLPVHPLEHYGPTLERCLRG